MCLCYSSYSGIRFWIICLIYETWTSSLKRIIFGKTYNDKLKIKTMKYFYGCREKSKYFFLRNYKYGQKFVWINTFVRIIKLLWVKVKTYSWVWNHNECAKLLLYLRIINRLNNCLWTIQYFLKRNDIGTILVFYSIIKSFPCHVKKSRIDHYTKIKTNYNNIDHSLIKVIIDV